MKKNVDAIFQVRFESTRFPGKMFKEILGKPLLWHVIQRVKAANLIDRIIIATTVSPEDEKIVDFCKKTNIFYYRGSVKNVLDRFYQTAKKFGSDIIIRITPDDPFKDPKIIDEFLKFFLKSNGLDYISNTIKPTYPEGLDLEIFTFFALQKCWKEAKKDSEKEHVTPYIWNNIDKFRVKNLCYKKDISKLRWTIDYEKDLIFAREVYKNLYPKKKIFLMQDILNLLKKNPELLKINQDIPYHEGYFNSLAKENLK